jgi:hypothetical protein
LTAYGGDVTITTSQLSKRELKSTNQGHKKLAHATLILGREAGNGEYDYVKSKADDNYSDLYLAYPQLQPGKYIVCCFVEGADPTVDSTVSVYSEKNIEIVESKVVVDDFLHNTYLDHARKNEQGRQVLSPSPLEWVAFDILADSCGFGYSAFHLDPNSSRKLGLEFDERYLFGYAVSIRRTIWSCCRLLRDRMCLSWCVTRGTS